MGTDEHRLNSEREETSHLDGDRKIQLLGLWRRPQTDRPMTPVIQFSISSRERDSLDSLVLLPNPPS
jgi:hypothetical protein